MGRAPFALALIAATAACSGYPATGNGSSAALGGGNTAATPVASEAPPEADGAAALRPGRWEGTYHIKTQAMPNVPAIDQTEKSLVCITPEQVKSGANPFTASTAPGCSYTSFRMSGGTIEGVMVCAGEGQQDQRAKTDVTGQYTAEWLRLQNTGMSLGAALGEAVVTTVLRRTGECRGDEPAPPKPTAG